MNVLLRVAAECWVPWPPIDCTGRLLGPSARSRFARGCGSRDNPVIAADLVSGHGVRHAVEGVDAVLHLASDPARRDLVDIRRHATADRRGTGHTRPPHGLRFNRGCRRHPVSLLPVQARGRGHSRGESGPRIGWCGRLRFIGS